MSLALITVHGDYFSTRVSLSFLLALGEVNQAVAPVFPSPRQQLAASSVFCAILCDVASRPFAAVVEPKAT